VSLLAVVSITLPIANITNNSIANAAPNSIEINSISEVSCTSVEILFESSVPKKSLVNYVITAAVDPSVGQPKNIKKLLIYRLPELNFSVSFPEFMVNTEEEARFIVIISGIISVSCVWVFNNFIISVIIDDISSSRFMRP
jgi:hypothetical protein